MMIRGHLRIAWAVAAFAYTAAVRGETPPNVGDLRGDTPPAPAAFEHAQGVLTGELARIFGASPTGNLGNVVFETADWTDNQRYVIDSVPTAVVVRAAGAKGFDYAAARILREVGYRRFAPHPIWEVLPANPPHSIELAADETPSYRSRNIWHSYFWPECRTNGHHGAWAFHHRMGGDAIEEVSAVGDDPEDRLTQLDFVSDGVVASATDEFAMLIVTLLSLSNVSAPP